ncbi:class I SAM-dependent methyltransferase [Streptosporangium sp. NBC_01810]|nr:class I SAM-dependent methyltransferase [Streptosporangium sp. NBC_01810]WSA28156.1 class I SAM-dependent methyltransferase [Streptosporangium sp. NBC_01810]
MGRITHRLLELGHEVVAVDESPEMLAHIRGTETVCSPIQTLALPRTFDLVLLIVVRDDAVRTDTPRSVPDHGLFLDQHHLVLESTATTAVPPGNPDTKQARITRGPPKPRIDTPLRRPTLLIGHQLLPTERPREIA